MWRKLEDGLPKKAGRYFIMVDSVHEVLCGDVFMSRGIAFASNYSLVGGWGVQLSKMVVTHWMEIPEIEDGN